MPTTKSYTCGASSTPLLHQTISETLRQSVQRTPNRLLWVFEQQGIKKTYREFLAEVEQCAKGFLSLGLVPKDRLAIWAGNYYEWALVQFAAAMIGLILVNVNPAYKSDELEYCLKKVGVKALVFVRRMKNTDLYETLFFSGTLDFHQTLMKIRTERLDNLLKTVEASISPDTAHNIQFTSGTTGHPKGALLVQNAVVNNSYFAGKRMQLDTKHHIICCGPPFFHSFGCTMGTMATVVNNATCVFPSPTWQPATNLECVHKYRCTVLYGTPTMFIDMMHHPDFANYDYQSLEIGKIGSTPCPTQLCKEIVKHFTMKRINVGYGLTETGPLSHLSSGDETQTSDLCTVGNVLPHIETKIIDKHGQTVALGERGEICTRGYSVTLGYWDEPQKTKEAITSDRWFHTGDQGIMDVNGRMQIVGRIKDCIIRGGENIYPAEIEEFLFKHPKIAQAQVVGVPDKRLGEECCAWIILKTGAQLSADEVRAHCRKNIATYKIPRYIQMKRVTDLPLTTSGKVQKFRIREQAIKDLKLDLPQASL